MKNIIIHPKLIGLALTGWLLGSVAGVQAAGPWYVATNGADSGNSGLDWSQAFASISNALTNAAASDTIWVSNGVYTLTAVINNSSSKKCKIRAMSTNARDTVLLGPGSNNVTSFRGVYMAGAGSLLQGFTVTNFYSTNDSYGAGVYCSAGLISNCVITANIMGSANGAGGGAYLTSAGTIDNCDIIGNRRWHPTANDGTCGGGVCLQSGSRAKNCRIVGNSGYFGGGFGSDSYGTENFIQDCVVASNTSKYAGGGLTGIGTITNCRVFANNATDTANGTGGILISSGPSNTTVIITGCVFSNNYGPVTGGIRNYIYGSGLGTPLSAQISDCIFINNSNGVGSGTALSLAPGITALIRNCLVANNSGDVAMYVVVNTGLVENCTIASNTASGSRVAGLYVTNAVTVVNSIIYHNLNVVTGQSNVYATADCTFSNSCIVPLSAVVGTGNTEADPQFVAKETGNFRLAPNSPCINTGLYQAWMTSSLDLDGRMRIRYGTVDMGAYECLLEGTIFMFH